MVKIPAEIKTILNNFIINLEKDNVQFDKMYLFGSYAKNQANKNSDIDLAIVSSKFSGNPILDNELIFNAKINASYELETHTFKSDEFDDSDPFVKEIIKTGILLT